MRHFLEGHHEFRDVILQPLSGAQVEGDTRPAPGIDVHFQRDKGFGAAVGSDIGLLEVSGYRHAPNRTGFVLAAHRFGEHITIAQRAQRSQDFELLVAHCIRVAARRRLHGHDAQQLKQVVLNHIAHGAGLVVEIAAAFHPKLFRNGDLHVLDQATPPQRLEQCVAETQCHEILNCLLAQVVINPVNLFLGEHRCDLFVDEICRRRVMTQGLFENHPRQRRNNLRLGEILADHGEKIGCGGKEEDANHAVPFAQQSGEGGIVLFGSCIEPDIVQQTAEPVPLLCVEFLPQELAARSLCLSRIGGAGQVRSSDAENPRFRENLSRNKASIESRQQLTRDQIARAAKKQHIESGKYRHRRSVAFACRFLVNLDAVAQ